MLVELVDVIAYYRPPGREAAKALDGAGLSLSAGEVVGLLGPNGAGKTTLMRVMLGMMHAESGRISVLGLDPAKHRHRIAKACGAVVDGQRELPPRWTPLDLLRFVGAGYGLSEQTIRQRGLALLERFGLAEHKNRVLNSYSRGMRQKLSLVLALLHEPKLLVLDEPTLGLDVEATREMLGLVRAMAEDGCGVLISSHQLSVIEQIAHKVAVIHRGRTVFQDSPAALMQRVGRGKVELEFESLPTEFLKALPDHATVNDRRVTLPLEVDSLVAVLVSAQRLGVQLSDLNRPLDFESAYLALLEERADAHVHLP